MTPTDLLTLDDTTMSACGFTLMKAGYAPGIAEAVLDESFDFDALGAMQDMKAIEALTALRGIGVWTAENYLIWALARRDVFPAGELALRVGWQRLTGSSEPLPTDGLRALAERWAPHRTAATFLIWHFYLGGPAGE